MSGIEVVRDVTRQGPEERVHVVRDRAALPRGLKAPGPLVLGRRARVNGSVRARGFVHLAAGAIVAGDVEAIGDVVVGAGAFVAGHVKAEGSVTLLHDATVMGHLDAAADATLRKGAKCGTLHCGGDLRCDGRARTGERHVGGRVETL